MRSGRRLQAAIVVALGALPAIAGCGGGRSTVPAHASAGATPPNAPFRWLVSTQGSQPTIADENRRAGTTAWRLPGPAADVGGLRSGDVTGYVAEQAIAPGQTQRIYVSAPGSRSVRLAIYRIGWYDGAGGREVLSSRALPLVAQPPCTHLASTGLTACAWHATLTFTVPPALPSGVYIVRMSARSGRSDCLFVVLASHPQPLLAQLPTSTYEAYNAWGGDSLYPGGEPVGVTGTTQGVEVSYDRPYDSVTGAGQFFARDVAMVRFLERYSYPVSYTTSESVDAEPAQLSGHRALVDFGHSEYWSQGQADAFERARDAGTSLLFFGSDTMAWRVRYARAREAGERAHTIVSYKEHGALDPDRGQPTGPFPGGGAALTGSAYVGCITPRVAQPGPPTYRYYSWTPAPALEPSWLFTGTGVGETTRIPGIVGWEPDQRTAATPPGTRLIGSGAVTCMPAAPGEPAPGPGQNVAETTIYTARSGAIVFNTGTLGWELGLEPVPDASPDAPTSPDPRVVRMTRNLLAHVLAG